MSPILDENGFVSEPDDVWAAQDRAMARINCGLCDDDGYRGSAVCDHEDRAETAKRGIELIRQTMGWTK